MSKKIESEAVEFKKSIAEKEEAGKTLAGMANKNGGTVYFGIDNAGKLIGIYEVKEKTITEIAHYFGDNIEPKLYPKIEVENVSGNEIVKVSVDKSSLPYHTFKGVPYIRVGPTTRKMSQDEYQRRLVYYKSTNKDYSSTKIPESSLEDVSTEAMIELRTLLKTSGRYKLNIDKLTDSQLLKDLLLYRDEKLTVAAVVLLGTEEALTKHLPYSEVRFGFKTSDQEIRNQDTEIYKGGYLTYYKQIWDKINSRNLTLSIPFQMRLLDKKAFDEVSIREAVNNAIVHRDYLLPSSVFIIQYPTKIYITSPGGFPEGITAENIINESKPRNKLIADILFKCELVEQFGNGVNLMYKNQLSLGKLPPNYSNSDENQVQLILDGTIQDIEFAKYVLRVAEEKNKELSDSELIILNRVNNNSKISDDQINDNLISMGLIERIGRDKYILSKQFYQDTNKEWEYTKRKGLSRNRNKELILEHLRQFNRARKQDFMNVLGFSISDVELSNLLVELKKSKKIYFEGAQRSKAGYWKLTNKP